ncbi:ABC transporter ATP-binding protein [Pseudomonas sp. dw_358]|uniref:ATP-binding cassette domain-containing protein n=1 Tax=Pseudomonas sp. dw_358 TaxID=2720083 RepID=UPI001BD4C5B9|nr:ABC transporter ATP-binding protein [Pseudomonas sp. dw_358]
MSLPLVDIDNLSIGFAGSEPLVRGVSFSIWPGQCVALVGESGSGKSLTARSLLGLAGDGAQVRAERFELAGRDARQYGEADWRDLRGTFAGLVMQDALVSLDPLRTIGQEAAEVILEHQLQGRHGTVRQRVERLLEEVGIPDPARRARQYAHELSGGLRQRALIAAAIAGDPRLIIADEPTTALDATVQKQVIAVLGERVRAGAGLLLISHDLALVAQIADWVCVLHQGNVVDAGPVAQVLRNPAHRYTRQLLAATPSAASRGQRLSSARFLAAGNGLILRDSHAERQVADEEVLRVEGISKRYRPRGWFAAKTAGFTALDQVSFSVRKGEVLGIVGESGSGKSTCANILLGLLEPDEGQVHLLGQRWSGIDEARRRPLRRQMQYIPQDPLSSFDPRYSVQRLVAENLAPGVDNPRQAVIELLQQVGLNADFLERRPRSLSGGQRQRIAIARALAAKPALIICDEPVSALDVYVQAQVLDLLAELQARHQLSLVFISHDLGVVQHVSDRVLVFHQGRVVEHGDVESLFANPEHAYTRELLSAL